MNYSDNTTPLHVLLKELIDRSNYTVYQLAKVCDINRSTLQKAVCGQRPISRDNLDKLIPYLHLTVSEQKELQKSILISEIGEISYQKNMYIRNLLSNAASLSHSYPAQMHPAAIDPNSLHGNFITGSFQIINMICNLLTYEVNHRKEVYFYSISSFHNDFFPALYKQLRTDIYLSVEMKHIVPFSGISGNNDPASLYNLRTLSYLMPFVMSAGNDNLSFYYCYEEGIAEKISTVPFSHSIVMPEYVVLLSADCENAVILQSDAVSYFKEQFFTVLQASLPLLNTVDTASLLSVFIHLSSETSRSYMLELQPCLTAFVDEEIIQNVINKSLPAAQQQLLTATLLRQCSNLKRISDFISVFSKRGLDDFVEKGIVYQVPLELYQPPCLQDRIKMLQRLIDANETGAKKFYMIKDTHFHPVFEIFTYNSSVLFSLTDSLASDASICILKENTIIDSFQAFLRHAVSHDLTYSIEETTSIFKEAVSRLKAQCDNI